MQTCQKLENSRVPKLTNVQEMEIYLQKIAEMYYIPGTSKYYPGAVSETVWMAITDKMEEGKWIDWYTGEHINLTDGVSGSLGMNTAI